MCTQTSVIGTAIPNSYSLFIRNGILSEEPVAHPLKLVEKTSQNNEESDSDLELDWIQLGFWETENTRIYAL